MLVRIVVSLICCLIVFLVNFGSNNFSALAGFLTPEAEFYQIDKSPEQVKVKLQAVKKEGKELATGVQEKVDAVVDNVQETFDFEQRERKNVSSEEMLSENGDG